MMFAAISQAYAYSTVVFNQDFFDSRLVSYLSAQVFVTLLYRQNEALRATFQQSYLPVCQHSQEHENEPDRRLRQKQVSDDLAQPRVIHGLHIVIDRLCIPAGA